MSGATFEGRSASTPKGHPQLSQCATDRGLTPVRLRGEEPQRLALKIALLHELQQGFPLLPRLLYGRGPEKRRQRVRHWLARVWHSSIVPDELGLTVPIPGRSRGP